MHRYGIRLSWLRWGSVAAAAVAVGLWMVAIVGNVQLVFGGYGANLWRGGYWLSEQSVQYATRWSYNASMADPPSAMWWFHVFPGKRADSYFVPAWVPVLMLSLPSIAARRSWARARRGGERCPTCGYVLRGLPAGSVCPECGNGIA